MINSSKTKPPKAEGSNSNRFRRNSNSASAPVAKPVSSASSSSRGVAENVVVALNAAKGINRYALEWTLTNVVQPEDHITLVALLQGGRNGRRRWGLPNLAGDCANRSHKAGKMGNAKEMAEEVTDSCSYMMQQLQRLCDSKQVKVSVKVVPGNTKGAVAIEAQRVGASWIILDSHLKKEEGKFCMDQLQCNLVIVKRSDAKILRLNLNMRTASERGGQTMTSNGAALQTSSKVAGSNHHQELEADRNHISLINNKPAHSSIPEEITSFGSPGARTPFTATDKGTSSASSSEPGTSPLTSAEAGKTHTNNHRDADDALIDETDSASDYGLHDALSDDESSSDESYSAFLARHPVCRTAYGSPDQRYKESTLSYFGGSDYASQPWLDYSLGNAQRESYCVDPWMATSKSRPVSASATPRVTASYQGRASTPASPLSSSKRFAGSSRLSLSMREGSHQANPSAEGSNVNTILHQRNSRYAHPVNSKAGFEADNGRWSNRSLTTQDLLDKFSRWDQDSESGLELDVDGSQDLERTSSVRRAMSLVKHVPAGPPPLCSICQHKAPVFGKPPRRFTYAELELATGGFSQANFLAEGGFGSVHRGILPDGQAVAVKQHKLASSQGDIEFCSEVEVLSCAQHRNVVMLIGYCIEDKRRLLVYEFICNGSLDSHLYGKEKGCLGWPARQKIAVGAARGLRYLHEECRVGCIVHRDMRPNNILLTHDYEPMVGDFGLARWQPDGDLGVQTRVIGTFGYLAPEYAQSGQVTEKADVYSFGVVLLELATGRKAVDINRPKGQQCLTEWARPLLEEHATQTLIDPLLNGNYSDYEVYCMLHAASLCLRKDPHLRPRMSQVLRILEGDVVIDKITPPVPSYSSKLMSYEAKTYKNRASGRSNEYKANQGTTRNSPLVGYNNSLGAETISAKLSSMCNDSLSCKNGGKLTYEALKAAYKDRGNVRRLSYEDMM